MNRCLTSLVGGTIAGLLALTLSGCGDASTPAPSSASQRPALTAGPNDADATALPQPAPAPSWDRLSELTAVLAAERATRTFARPSLPAQRWFRELSPLLSPAAAQDYVGTDPARVPAHAVSGGATLLPSTSTYLARVAVPTDVGPYTVTLSRTSQTAPWLVERLQPPPGVGP